MGAVCAACAARCLVIIFPFYFPQFGPETGRRPSTDEKPDPRHFSVGFLCHEICTST